MRRILATGLALATLAVGACSSGERPTFVDQGGAVDTIPAGTTNPRGTGDADPSAATASTPMTGDAEAMSTVEPGQGGPGGEGTTTLPPITDDTLPRTPGLGAVLSPTGVLVEIEAETASGYVVRTPCGGRATIPWGQPLGPVQVVIDPGHGGDEQGAVGGTGLTEAELNLDVARRTATELTRRSIVVVLTRNGDYRVPISRRAALADALGAAAFVSIHHNTPASAPSAEPGTEVFVQSTSDPSRRLGGLVYEEVVDELSQFDVEWTSRSDAGVLMVLDQDGADAYGIARYPSTPSALVELAYIGNPREEALLVTDDYREAAAEALADGIERYLTTSDPGSGFIASPRRTEVGTDTGGTDGCVDPPLG